MFFLRNPLMPAFVLGMLAPSRLAPDALVTASRVLVFAMLPAGFLAVGIHLAASLPRTLAVPPLFNRELGLAVVLRLLVAPLLLLLVTLPLIDLPAPYLLMAAMPCGINVLLIANVYGLERRLAAAMIAWSTALVLAAVIAVTLVRA
jgi:predicted permease